LILKENAMTIENLEFHPLTPGRWDDFVSVMGQNGASGGCWCMYWRTRHKEWATSTKEQNRQAIKSIVDEGREPGLIAYANGIPAAWVSLGPREDFPTLNNSRILKAVDEQPVWAIVCFFIHRNYRRKGMMRLLIDAAVDYAHSKGAKIVEAYPHEPEKKVESSSLFLGVIEPFKEAGFVEVARRSPNHPVLRKVLE
jgi:GNAT superfamily N-acetyltransferase